MVFSLSASPGELILALSIFGSFLTLGFIHPKLQFIFAIVGLPALELLDTGTTNAPPTPLTAIYAIEILIVFTLTLEAVSSDRFWRLLRTSSTLKAGVLFLGWIALLALVHPVERGAAAYLSLRYGMFVVFLLLTPVFLGRTDVRRLLIPAILLVALVTLVLSGVETMRQLLDGVAYKHLGGNARATGIFPSVNSFATYVTVSAVFFLLWAWQTTKRLRYQLLSYLVFVGALLQILLTFSRRVIPGLITGLTVGFGLLKGGGRRRSAMAFGAASILALWILVPDILVNPRFAGAVENFFSTRGDRTAEMFVQAVVQVWPVFIGFGVGSSSLFLYETTGVITQRVVDSFYSSLFLNFGLIGLTLFAVTVVLGLRALVGLRRRQDGAWPIALASGAAVLVLLVSSVFGNTLLTFPNAMYFWLFLGTGVALHESDESMRPLRLGLAPRGQRRPARGGGVEDADAQTGSP